MFGYSREELLGLPVEILIPERFQGNHPTHRAAYTRDPRVRLMGEGRDLFGRKKSGIEFPVEIRLSPLQTRLERSIICVVRDVTLRKKAEAKFWGFLELDPDAKVIIKQSGDIFLVNSQTERLFGYSREELLGQPVEVLIPERFRVNHPSYREAFFQTPRVRPLGGAGELYGLRKNGTEFPVEISLSPLETEEGVFVSSAIRDITTRKQAEEALRLRDRAMQAVSQGIMITDPNQRDNPIIYVSQAFERITGYSSQDVLGRNYRFLHGKDTGWPTHTSCRCHRRGYGSPPPGRATPAGPKDGSHRPTCRGRCP
jgi:protein-histidine pros-kinase